MHLARDALNIIVSVGVEKLKLPILNCLIYENEKILRKLKNELLHFEQRIISYHYYAITFRLIIDCNVVIYFVLTKQRYVVINRFPDRLQHFH